MGKGVTEFTAEICKLARLWSKGLTVPTSKSGGPCFVHRVEQPKPFPLTKSQKN